MIVFIILIIVFPQNVFFIIFSIYALSGIIMYLPNRMRGMKHEERTRREGKALNGNN